MKCPHCQRQLTVDEVTALDPTSDSRERVTYFVLVGADADYVKVGTTLNLSKRIRDLRFALAVPMTFLGSTTLISERAMQRRWQHLSMPWNEATAPSWIKRPRAAGPREWFRATPELLEEISRLCS